MFDVLRESGFDVATRNHAEAILRSDFAAETGGLVSVLLGYRLSARDIIQSGGGQAASTMRLRDRLVALGWRKHEFRISTVVDGVQREATSHEVDHVIAGQSGTLALEIEWNNKDPFFDRDLENFKRLHAQGAISLGILITRGAKLQEALVPIVSMALREAGIIEVAQLGAWGVKERTRRQMKNLDNLLQQHVPFADAFARSFVADKFGAATTHWDKLKDRIDRGVGNPCPLLLIGIPASIVEP